MEPESSTRENTANLDALIEAILFARGEPVAISELSSILGAASPEIEQALTLLDARLIHGIALIRTGEIVTLRTAPAAAEVVTRAIGAGEEQRLGKAALETIAIIAYQGPISRSRIEYIRGVQSAFVLRSLLIRGLIERVESAGGERSYAYQASPELLAHLGVGKATELPEYEGSSESIRSFENKNLQHGEEPAGSLEESTHVEPDETDWQ